MKVISLNTPSTASTIYIGKDATKSRLPALTNGVKCFVVTDSNVHALYGDFFTEYFKDAEIFVLPAGEEYKNFASLQAILEKMSAAGLHRTSRVFAVGGGVIGDIGGLAAALYMRGISCVQIPTTLLAQVDSSVGGKTAIDLDGVKNVVGAFYQPQEVLVNPTFLSTLPPREIKCGLGEIVKYAALNGEIFDCLERGFEDLEKLIAVCIEHKARVVERDEKEAGERKSLNVGHTTGHAIELTSGLSHGECVLYGMWLETDMAIKAGVCEKEYGARLKAIVKRALKNEPVSKLDLSNVKAFAGKAKSDKKNADDNKIVMSVAKAKNEWTVWALSFEEYVSALEKAVLDWKREELVCEQ
mgnify:CR=1 FL=1